MGALESHVFGVRADRSEQPDRIVFDLDPSPRSPWPAGGGTAKRTRARAGGPGRPGLREPATRVRERWEDLGLASFLKTTGGKGLHIVAPIRRGPGWDEVKRFADDLAASLVREDPAGPTTPPSKA